MITDKIDIRFFLYSLAAGILLIYLMGEDKKIVYVYPNMTNYKDIMFEDHTNQCYQYKPKYTPCPSNTKNITQI